MTASPRSSHSSICPSLSVFVRLLQIFTETKVLDVIVDGQSGGPATLVVSGPGGEELEVSSELTLLNLPRNRLLELPSVGPSLPQEMLDTLKCIKFDLPPDVYPLNKTEIVGTTALTKAYLYFKDAWWRTKLQKTSGTTPEDGWLPVVRTAGQDRNGDAPLLLGALLV